MSEHDTIPAGVTFIESSDGCFIVQRGEQRIVLCPCCDRPMKNRRSAELVANAVFQLGYSRSAPH